MKTRFTRLLSPPTVTRAYTTTRPCFCVVYQPPDVPGPHMVRLSHDAHVQQHGLRLWIYSPKRITR
jgi:hypothetical protein